MSAVGLHRVLAPAGVLPQAAQRLDTDPAVAADEVRVRVERLNLDAASFRQLAAKHGGDGAAVRAEVLGIVAARGKMHNPVTGSGGMLIGTVDQVGPASPLGLRPGDRVATLVSLTLTPLVISDGLTRWDGRTEQVPCAGYAILFGRSVAAVLPDDLPAEVALAVLAVLGCPVQFPARPWRDAHGAASGRGGVEPAADDGRMAGLPKADRERFQPIRRPRQVRWGGWQAGYSGPLRMQVPHTAAVPFLAIPVMEFAYCRHRPAVRTLAPQRRQAHRPRRRARPCQLPRHAARPRPGGCLPTAAGTGLRHHRRSLIRHPQWLSTGKPRFT